MIDARWMIVSCAGLLAAGCGGSTDITGDRDATSDTWLDTPADTVHDTISDPVADTGGDCCLAPMVLDPVRGICVDPSGAGGSCDDTWDGCAFGQLCLPEWGEGYLGDFCHLPCSMDDDWLCPEGMVCAPSQCCDIPDQGCLPDTCTPPLLYHPGLWTCVSPLGLGMDCSTLESCNEGQDCVGYLGVDGGMHWSCEIPCAGGGLDLCPNAMRCVDWDDGPENVCEPFAAPRGCDDPEALTCGLPGKFMGVDRESICPGCYGAVFCIEDSDAARAALGSIDMAGAVDCDTPPYPPAFCGDGLMVCGYSFRSGVDDCPGMMPSTWLWSLTCAVAHLPQTVSVHCYWLE
jgi:hypothetical protein